MIDRCNTATLTALTSSSVVWLTEKCLICSAALLDSSWSKMSATPPGATGTWYTTIAEWWSCRNAGKEKKKSLRITVIYSQFHWRPNVTIFVFLKKPFYSTKKMIRMKRVIWSDSPSGKCWGSAPAWTWWCRPRRRMMRSGTSSPWSRCRTCRAETGHG